LQKKYHVELISLCGLSILTGNKVVKSFFICLQELNWYLAPFMVQKKRLQGPTLFQGALQYRLGAAERLLGSECMHKEDKWGWGGWR